MILRRGAAEVNVNIRPDGHSGSPEEEIRELAELATLGTMFSRIEQMRVVPSDVRSFRRLDARRNRHVAAAITREGRPRVDLRDDRETARSFERRWMVLTPASPAVREGGSKGESSRNRLPLPAARGEDW
jgi:hypothetical protein